MTGRIMKSIICCWESLCLEMYKMIREFIQTVKMNNILIK